MKPCFLAQLWEKSATHSHDSRRSFVVVSMQVPLPNLQKRGCPSLLLATTYKTRKRILLFGQDAQ